MSIIIIVKREKVERTEDGSENFFRKEEISP
jgi:hypothetical protein